VMISDKLSEKETTKLPTILKRINQS
jgi:hypothetical protein